MARINWSDEFEKFLLDCDYYSQFTTLVLETKKCSLSHYTRYHNHYYYIEHILVKSPFNLKLETLSICWRNHIRNLEQW